MKKILFPIMFSIMVLLLTSLAAYAGPVEDQKVAHIRQTFDVVANEFYQKSTKEQTPVGGMIMYLSDETTKEHYYLTMSVDGSGIITMVTASIQVELANNVVEIRNEGLRVDYESKNYNYYLDCKLIFRNENCRIEIMEPKEGVWDTVLGKLLLDSIPE